MTEVVNLPMSVVHRFWQKVRRTDGCWFWTGAVNPFGYGYFNRSHTHKADCVLAHRFAWELAFGSIQDGLCVLHRCDTPSCVNPAHLFLGTRTDNSEDKVHKGRQRGPQGEDHPRCKLTSAEVHQMRELHRQGHSKSSLARRFRTSLRNARSILDGKSWRHLLEHPHD